MLPTSVPDKLVLCPGAVMITLCPVLWLLPVLPELLPVLVPGPMLLTAGRSGADPGTSTMTVSPFPTFTAISSDEIDVPEEDAVLVVDGAVVVAVPPTVTEVVPDEPEVPDDVLLSVPAAELST